MDLYYNEDWDYDSRGNIMKLNRKGMTNRLDLGENCYQASTIDSLTYIYAPGTNKLVQVTDKAPCPEVITLPAIVDRDIRYAASQEIRIEDTDVFCGVNLKLSAGNNINILDTLKIPKFCGIPATVVANTGPCGDDKYTEGFNQQSTTGQYLSDNSGSLTFDPNKNLTYYYNYLNLPYRIVGGENDELQMLYSADGTLLQRKYLKNSVIITKTDYLRGVEYKNSVIEAIYHKDGRVVRTGSTNYSYEYNIKDHLGNVRVTFADDNGNGLINGAERRSINDYYAFGMEWNGSWQKSETYYPKNKYQYNGKELFDEMSVGLYFYNARMMDPVLGRFTSLDPLSGIAPGWTGYRYGFNNPLKYTDPDGRYENNEATSAYAKSQSDYLYSFQSSNSEYNGLKEQQQKGTRFENSSKSSGKEPPLILFAQNNGKKNYYKYAKQFEKNFKEGDGIYNIFSHASNQHIENESIIGVKRQIVTGKEFNTLMIKVYGMKWISDVEDSQNNEKNIEINLYGCNTAAKCFFFWGEEQNVEKPFAQIISEYYPEMTVRGFNGFGVYSQISDGSIKLNVSDNNTNRQILTYKNGKIIQLSKPK